MGIRDRYCLMTIMVAAGAVAAAIAPNTNENGSVCPLRSSPSVTNKTATKLSNMAMTMEMCIRDSF